jgi:hypothetical protein
MEQLFKIDDSFSDTVARYVRREMMKGKDPRKTMARLMVHWLLNALKNTPREDGNEIYLYLTGQMRLANPRQTRRKRAAVVEEMRNTMALAIINNINYKGARGVKGTAYYQLAKKYAQARKFSAGLHQAGFMTGVRFLRRMGYVRADGPKTPKYRHEPGSIETNFSPDNLTIEATNFAKIIAEIAPNAFTTGANEVAMMFNRYIAEDMAKDQLRAGLNVK